MEYVVSVKPDDASAGGWIIQYFDWAGPGHPVLKRNIEWTSVGGGEFRGSIVASGPRCCLACTLIFGVKIVVSIEPDAQVVFPDGQSFPITFEPDLTQDEQTICFAVGG
jgi:hypothetical protein